MFTQMQKDWAKSEIESIMNTGNNKTRYKKIAAVSEDLEKLENALLIVAQSKAEAYQLACEGKSRSAFGWASNPLLTEQNECILTLQHAFIEINEISMVKQTV